jgi:hypothetical protein
MSIKERTMKVQHTSFLAVVHDIVRAASKVHPYAQAWFDLGTVKIEIQPPTGSHLKPLIISSQDRETLQAEGLQMIDDERYQIRVGQYFTENKHVMPNPEVWLLPDGTPVVLRRSGPSDEIIEVRAWKEGVSPLIDSERLDEINSLLTAWAHELRATERARHAEQATLTHVTFE